VSEDFHGFPVYLQSNIGTVSSERPRCFSPRSVQLITSISYSLTLREEHKLKGFQNRFLMRICGPKREAGEDCIMRFS
jgi:hypothetical protein